MSNRTRFTVQSATRPTGHRSGRSLSLRASAAAASFAAFGLLATACSDSKTISSADSGVSTTVAESTTTVAETTTTLATTTTTVAVTLPPVPTIAPPPPPPACPTQDAPSGGAVSVTPITGDWNGDAVLDSAISWAEVGGGSPQWFVRTEISGGPASSWALGDLGVGFAQLIDRVDVDFSLGVDPGVNRDEFVAITGSAASGLILGVFGVDDSGCVFQFDNGSDGAFQLPVTGTVSDLSGVMCDGGAGSQFMVAKQARTLDGGATWQTTDSKIVRSAQSLGYGVSIEGELLGTDGSLNAYGIAECFGTLWV